jgi:hypothetical protein
MVDSRRSDDRGLIQPGLAPSMVRIAIEVAVIAERLEQISGNLETVVGPNLVTLYSSLVSIAGSLADLVEELKQLRRVTRRALGFWSLTKAYLKGGR